MALIVETGTGIVDAASYVTTATIDTYWTSRAHTTLSVTWAAGTTANKEGAARETTDFIDATYGPFYKGTRKGYVQGLLWPRTDAQDGEGYPLPDLPPELVQACCELAARAISARLAADETITGSITMIREKVGEIDTTTQYGDGAEIEKRYGFVNNLLAPILDGSQPGGKGTWEWR